MQQATLTQKNAMRMASNAYSLLDLVVTLADIDYVEQPWFLSSLDDMEGGGQEEECSSGTMTTKTESVSASSQKVLLTLQDCVLDGVLFKGSIQYTLDYAATGADDRTDLLETYFIEYLLIQDEQEKMELSGDIIYSARKNHQYTGNLTAKLDQQDRIIKLDNLDMVAGKPTKLSVKFYDSKEGYVDVALAEYNSQIVLSGAQTLMTLIPKVYDMANLSGFVHEFALGLDSIVPYALPLFANLTLEAFIEWPYRENLPPVMADVMPLEVTRLDELHIDAGEYFSDATDFLSYTVSLSNATPSCSMDQQKSDFENFTVQFQCRGDQTLSLKVNDGLHEREQILPVRVLPRLAEVYEIDDQILDEVATLNVPIVIQNEDEDGPFALSLFSAPAGLSISNDGYIRGRPKTWLKEDNASFSIGLVADNGRAATTDFHLDVASEPSDVDFVPAETVSRCSQPWTQLSRYETPVRSCFSQTSVFIESIDGGQVATVWGQPFSFGNGALWFQLWFDVDANGLEDLVLGVGDKIVVIDPAGNRLIKTIPLPINLLGTRLLPGDVAGNKLGHRELLLYQAANNRYFQIDVVSGIVQTLVIPAKVAAFGRVDGNDEPDLILENGEVRALSGSILGHTQPAMPYEKFLLTDIDGDAQRELVRYVVDVYGRLDSPVLNVTELGNLSAQQAYSLLNPSGPGTAWHPTIGFANLDGVPGVELFAHVENQADLYLFKLSGANLALVKTVTLPDALVSGRDVPLAELADDISATYWGLPYLLSYGSGVISPAVDNRQTLKTGGTSKLFPAAGDNFLLFLADHNSVQKIELDANGQIVGLSTADVGAEIDATSIQFFDANGDGNKEYVAAYSDSTSRYRVINVSTGVVLRSVALAAPITGPVRLVDIDHTGGLELVAANAADNRCLAVYRVGQSTPYQILHCGSQLYAHKTMAQLKVQDLDGNGYPELMDVEYSTAGNTVTLSIYEQGAGTVTRTLEFVQSASESVSAPVLSVQDFNGDSQLDVAISYSKYRGKTLFYFNKQGQLGRVDMASSPIIPDVLVPKQNASILGFEDIGSSTRLQEIELRTGSVIWSSKRYVGRPSASSLHVLGSNPYQNTKLIVTDDGVLRFTQ